MQLLAILEFRAVIVLNKLLDYVYPWTRLGLAARGCATCITTQAISSLAYSTTPDAIYRVVQVRTEERLLLLLQTQRTQRKGTPVTRSPGPQPKHRSKTDPRPESETEPRVWIRGKQL